jgi:ribosomal protein S18 acetylase RimI-like enzyme
MEMDDKRLVLRSPGSPSDWDVYFDLRWRILRAPWGQPRGSERDSAEKSAFHLLLLDSDGKTTACGRLHLNNPNEAQVKYMAVDEDFRGRGYGGRILQALESEAGRRGARKIVLNSRENALEFYIRHGYRVIGEAETLFGVIRHVRMEKVL